MARRSHPDVLCAMFVAATLVALALPGFAQDPAGDADAVAEDKEFDFLGEEEDDDDLFADPIAEEAADRPLDEAELDRAERGEGVDDKPAPQRPLEPPSADEPARREAATPGASPTGPTRGVEEILITGEAVQGAVLEADTSAVAFDSEDLEAMGVEDVSDIAAFTPNLEIVSPGQTTATFFIRGVGLSDFSANAAGAVAIYVDDVALNSPPLQVAQIFDVENISVERGPQGSGPGRNASAGAIKIYSRRPTMESTARLRISLGKFESNDIRDVFSQDYEGALNVALVPEVLSTRVAFRFTQSDPFFTNRCGDAPAFADRAAGQRICGEAVTGAANARSIQPGLDRHVGDRELWALRGALRLLPPDLETDMDWTLNVHGSRRNQDGTFGQAIGSGQAASGGVDFGGRTQSGYIEPDNVQETNALLARGLSAIEARDVRGKHLAQLRPLDIRPFHGDYNRTGRNKLDTWGGFLRGEIAFDAFQVRTTTGLDGYHRDTRNDSDFTPNVLFETDQENDSWQVFQELELTGELEALPIVWKTGGYFLIEDLEAKSDIALSFENFNVARKYEQDLTSFALHAGFSWDLFDDFSFEAGGRYNYSHKGFEIRQRLPNIPAVPPVTDQKDRTWDHFTGNLGITYRFSEAVSAYAKYNRGWKSGHFNTNGVPRDPASPEKIDAVEIGLHAEWFDGRMSLRGAGFYYNYEDYQVFIFEDNPVDPPSLEIINANDAEIRGLEADVTLRPLEASFAFVPESMEGLEISLLFAWLDSEFLDFQNTQFVEGGAGGTIPVLVDFSGNQLPNAPNLNLSGSVRWIFDLGAYGQLTPRWDFAWKDDVFFDPSDGKGSPRFDGSTPPDFAVGQPDYWLHNVRLGWQTADGRAGIAAWCRNVLDTRYKSYAFDATRFEGVVINFLGDPRSCGAELSFSW